MDEKIILTLKVDQWGGVTYELSAYEQPPMRFYSAGEVVATLQCAAYMVKAAREANVVKI